MMKLAMSPAAAGLLLIILAAVSFALFWIVATLLGVI